MTQIHGHLVTSSYQDHGGGEGSGTGSDVFVGGAAAAGRSESQED